MSSPPTSRWSLRRRLALATVAIACAVVAAFAIVLLVVAQRAAWDQHDRAQIARARAYAALAEHDDDGYELKLPAEMTPTSYLEVWTADGAVLARSRSLGDRHLAMMTSRLDEPVASTITIPDGQRGRAIALRFVPRDEAVRGRARPLTLVLAEGIEDVELAIASVRNWFIAAGVIGLIALATLTSWIVARHLRPLDRLTGALATIDDRNLSSRLPIANQPAELVPPIAKLNQLFERLQAALERERELTANIAHELRTPLAGLRTLLEVTRIADRSGPEYREAISDALAIVIELGAVVNQLLALARLAQGSIDLDYHPVALRALVDECWSHHAATARHRQLEFDNRVAPETVVVTDRSALRIAIGNLLANAAEYTAPGGWVRVCDAAGPTIDVIDSGPPIAGEHLDRIFERLWRGDAARSSAGVHCGIGLPLARALCEQLSYSLVASSDPDGSVRFRIAPAGYPMNNGSSAPDGN